MPITCSPLRFSDVRFGFFALHTAWLFLKKFSLLLQFFGRKCSSSCPAVVCVFRGGTLILFLLAFIQHHQAFTWRGLQELSFGVFNKKSLTRILHLTWGTIRLRFIIMYLLAKVCFFLSSYREPYYFFPKFFRTYGTTRSSIVWVLVHFCHYWRQSS